MENVLNTTVAGIDLVPQQARMVIPTTHGEMHLADVVAISKELFWAEKTWNDIETLDYAAGMRAPFHLNEGKGYPNSPGTTLDGYKIVITLK